MRRIIHSWLNKGNAINVKHCVCLLDAEQVALEGKHERSSRLYSEAVISATHVGIWHDAALAS
jgi:hypothetical protein